MRAFGLVGYPLTHSFSKYFFEKKFRHENIHGCSYSNFPLEDIHALPQLLQEQPLLVGLNITIPHKVTVLSLLDHIDPVAKEVGAVNCIKIGKNIISGYNTDVYGFERSILPFLENKYERALIIGTGGASMAVKYVLTKLGIDTWFLTRNPSQKNHIAYQNLGKESIAHFPLIINTTPLGMYPNVHACPDIPYEMLTPGHFLYDVVYNPQETTFMNKGISKGAMVMNGLKMLEFQAEKSWEIWNDPALPRVQ